MSTYSVNVYQNYSFKSLLDLTDLSTRGSRETKKKTPMKENIPPVSKRELLTNCIVVVLELSQQNIANIFANYSVSPTAGSKGKSSLWNLVVQIPLLSTLQNLSNIWQLLASS